EARMLRSEDLERLLDRIEDLARTGALDAARQLLSELQNMLDNLQAGRPMMGNQQQMGEMMENMNELGEMIRRQEELLNETFRAERGRNPNTSNNQPMTKEEFEQALRDLQQGQQDLAEALEQLMKGMQDGGMDLGRLGEAGQAMGEAAGELGQGAPGAALGPQGRALEALREGAQSLMQQFANGQQPGSGNGPGQLFGRDGLPNADPLGRPQRPLGPDLGTTVKVPDEIDTQRAREILEAIRRRLGEIGRPELEREYLERLLDRF
ncbi:MAG: DUF4175 family protein, partial [Alphaproteobacteria bacterium]